MGWIQVLKIGAVLAVVLAVGAVLWTVRNELIAKGKNIVYAQDNAALVEQQKKQASDDAERIKSQGVYIEHLESQGTQFKETIKYVQVPATACKDDGATDPRLGSFGEWLQLRSKNDSGAAPGGRPAQGPVPKAAPAH